ncbi:ThiF family adenylyltransferase [Nocardia sp. BMG111209]|uniref:ThiF family adenylyltransferase n=1 Tax=Nocardia sp. BMG111209 TaxID=1160137 RepID=UPI000478323B|nr:ThiF family adenylyltransferase [Nocardia sp. BMG111209]
MMEILDPARDGDRIAAVLARPGYRLVDAWTPAVEEYRALDPAAGPIDVRYVVYEYRRLVVKMTNAVTHYRLCTTRNRHLIDDLEQARWAAAPIGVAGLSVGASALSVCALTGARRFRIADPDRLGLTNLNRLPASVCDIGMRKTTLAYRRVLELDPYAEVSVFDEGITADTVDEFLGLNPGGEPLAVLVEEMDDAAAKIDVRRRARAAGIPVVMATDNGDNVILDVERFDLDRAYPLLHGAAEAVPDPAPEASTDPRRRAATAARIVGADITPRTRFSLTEVGASLRSWPQLGTAATVAGATAAYAARLIVCGDPLPSGRFRVDLDRALLGAAADTATRWNELDRADFLAAMATDDPTQG